MSEKMLSNKAMDGLSDCAVAFVHGVIRIADENELDRDKVLWVAIQSLSDVVEGGSFAKYEDGENHE